MHALRFSDRAAAGIQLGEALSAYADRADVCLLALPRGGVPVAREIARALATPLRVLIVRKLGAPGCPELALGAVASGGNCVLNPRVLEHFPMSDERLARLIAREQQEIQRREQVYAGPSVPDLRDQVVILVDDGMATGATMLAAIGAVRAAQPARIVVALPVAPRDALPLLRQQADEVVCLLAPASLEAVGKWYADFRQLTDQEVCELLDS